MSSIELQEIKNAILTAAKNPNQSVTLSDGRSYTLKSLEDLYRGYKIVKEIEAEESATEDRCLAFRLKPRQA
jgi:hypothetical protein